jgi:hypothetical protein
VIKHLEEAASAWVSFRTLSIRHTSELADLAAYLASARAASITGAEYVIDGGIVPTV